MFFFETHEFVGLATLGLIVLFWLNLMLRQVGTDVGALFPWFSAQRRAALLAHAKVQLGSLARLRLPPYIEGSALASAVHGLGLLLITLMASTGAAWWLLGSSPAGNIFKEIHESFANFVWVFLIAHAGLAVLHHLRGEASLSHMWSLGRRT